MLLLFPFSLISRDDMEYNLSEYYILYTPAHVIIRQISGDGITY